MSISTDYRLVSYDPSWAPERASPECAVVCEGISPGLYCDSYQEEPVENPVLAAGLIRVITKSEQDCFNVMILTKADLTVGRESQCDFVITSIDVSRKQCKVEYRKNRWWLRNLSNTNGTFVNGIKVSEGSFFPLSDGSLVTFGNTSNAHFKYIFVEDYEQHSRLERIRFARANNLSQSESVLQEEVQQVDTQRVDCSKDAVQSEIEQLKAVANSWYDTIAQLKKDHESAENAKKNCLSEAKRIEEGLFTLRESEREIRDRIRDWCDLQSPIYKKLLLEVQCSICHEVMISPVALKCKHAFCEWCVKKWRAQGNYDCPCCRDKSVMQNPTTCPLALERIIEMIAESLLPESYEERKKSIVEHKKGLEKMGPACVLVENLPANNNSTPPQETPEERAQRENRSYREFLEAFSTHLQYDPFIRRRTPASNRNRRRSRREVTNQEPVHVEPVELVVESDSDDDAPNVLIDGDNIYQPTDSSSVAIFVEVDTDSASEEEELPSPSVRRDLRRVMPNRRAARMSPYSRDEGRQSISANSNAHSGPQSYPFVLKGLWSWLPGDLGVERCVQ